MGNYKFRLSDMIPNAWFYKLRDMSKTKITTNHHKKPPYGSSSTTPPPQNHHFSHPINHTPKSPPRKSSKRLTPNRKTIYKPSPKHTSLTESTHSLQDFFRSPSSESTQSPLTSCTCRLSSSPSDIIIDVTETRKIFSPEKELKLPPIITKPAKPSLSSKKVEQTNQTPARKSISGVKLRSNSPKLAMSKRFVQKSARRKNMSELSFAVVKSSFDPQKDFKESMMEMIVGNNIRASKDLEELLACYLALNSDEYHDVIVKAFEQIWFSLPHV